jgi:hypothetical protein
MRSRVHELHVTRIAMVCILGVAEGGDERANLLCAWLANPQSDRDRRYLTRRYSSANVSAA